MPGAQRSAFPISVACLRARCVTARVVESAICLIGAAATASWLDRVPKCVERNDMVSLAAQDELGLAHVDALRVAATLHCQVFHKLTDVGLGHAYRHLESQGQR